MLLWLKNYFNSQQTAYVSFSLTVVLAKFIYFMVEAGLMLERMKKWDGHSSEFKIMVLHFVTKARDGREYDGQQYYGLVVNDGCSDGCCEYY